MRTIDQRPDDETAWAAFEARDWTFDGKVIGAVTTTGIYCKPSCPARRPKRAHVVFYKSAAEARAAGYRACLRCRPDDVSRDLVAVHKATTLIEQAEEPLPLASWRRRSAIPRIISSACSRVRWGFRRRPMRGRCGPGAPSVIWRVTSA